MTATNFSTMSKESEHLSVDASASQKYSRPSGDSPQNWSKKKLKKRWVYLSNLFRNNSRIYQIKSGHDTAFCEGHCNTWFHRKCAGLSRPLFVSLEKSTDPFHCPHCHIRNLTRQMLAASWRKPEQYQHAKLVFYSK